MKHSGSHRSLPLPSILEVTNLENGRTTKVESTIEEHIHLRI